jgi:hypothetical protein
MTVYDLDVMSPVLAPYEANAPLIVYPNAMLPAPVAFEGFQAIAGRRAEIAQRFGVVDHVELPDGNLGNGPQMFGR